MAYKVFMIKYITGNIQRTTCWKAFSSGGGYSF